MKKITLFAVIAMTLLLAACNKATKIEVVKDNILMPVKGGADTIVVRADASWTVSSPEWVTIDKHEKSFVVIVPENTSKSKHEGTIVLSGSAGVTKPLTISQNYKASYLEVGETAVEFTNQGGKKLVDVLTDGVDVKVTPVAGITAEYNDGKLTLSTPANDTPKAIEGVLKITVDGLSADLSVSVAGKVCKTCNGRGVVICPQCKGSGFKSEPCHECGGVGYGFCCDYTGLELCYKNHVNNQREVNCPDCTTKK